MHWGYARVSSQEQSEGQSIDSQTRRLQDAGIAPERIVVEVGSATKGKTPELFKLFAKAAKGEVTSVLAIRQDRFQRSRKMAAAMWTLIDEHRVAFRFLDQPDIDPADPNSVLQASILGAFAQFETQQLSQRTKNGIEQSKIKKLHHGRAPWGYICIDGKLHPDPEQWDNARKVITGYLSDGSSTGARRLRHQLNGKPMGVSAFARWLLSPPLRGGIVRSTNGEKEVFWGMHKPLIQPGEWEQIQAIRQRNRVNPGAYRGSSKPSIGTGLFNCASCGNKLSKVGMSNRTQNMYRCRMVKGGGCDQGHLNWITQDSVAGHIRRAIAVAAKQLAQAETPHEFPEPPELSALKQERDEFKRMKSARAQRQAEELQDEINAMAARLQLTSTEREQRVSEEFKRLSAKTTLEAMTDEELRSVAVRYGLQFRVNNKVVDTLFWSELGPQKIGVLAIGLLDNLDQLMQ